MTKEEEAKMYEFVVDATFSTIIKLTDEWGHTAVKGGEVIR